MRIAKPGRMPEPEWGSTCPRCGCEFECGQYEATISEGQPATAVCPSPGCKEQVTVAPLYAAVQTAVVEVLRGDQYWSNRSVLPSPWEVTLRLREQVERLDVTSTSDSAPCYINGLRELNGAFVGEPPVLLSRDGCWFRVKGGGLRGWLRLGLDGRVRLEKGAYVWQRNGAEQQEPAAAPSKDPVPAAPWTPGREWL